MSGATCAMRIGLLVLGQRGASHVACHTPRWFEAVSLRRGGVLDFRAAPRTTQHERSELRASRELTSIYRGDLRRPIVCRTTMTDDSPSIAAPMIERGGVAVGGDVAA